MPRTVTILGATGSIGASTLDLIRANRDDFTVLAVTANSDAAKLAAIAREFGAQRAVIADERCIDDLRAALGDSGIAAGAGAAAITEAADMGADWTMSAIVGCAGLAPTMAALRHGKTVALANKEALVSSGALMMAAAHEHGATLLPVDSEHNAIFQCLAGNSIDDVAKITLTASGGPFRTASLEEMARVTPEAAVRHPNWSMGAKISIDSATMMNKGLELIEAHYLFGMGADRLDVLVHPQSVVHSMVTYRDGSTLAQLGPPDMRVPIASTLAWPDRMMATVQPMDLAAIGQLSFEAPDPVRFPALRLARAAMDTGGAMPAIMNAANETAVAAFLARHIGFLDIARIVEAVCDRYCPNTQPASIADVLAHDAEARRIAAAMMKDIAA